MFSQSKLNSKLIECESIIKAHTEAIKNLEKCNEKPSEDEGSLINLSELKRSFSEMEEILDANIAGMIDITDRMLTVERETARIKGNQENQLKEFSEKNSNVAKYIENSLKDILVSSDRIGRRTDQLKAVFFVQLAETWPSIASIWGAFNKDCLWDAKIVVLPFYHPYMKGENISSFLCDEGIAFERSEIYKIDEHRPDIVFYQEPYDSTQPEEYQIRSLVEKGYRVGYSPYGIELGGTDEGLRYQFDLNMQNLAWVVFARSERHKSMYGKYCSRGNSHVVVTGHPKFDLLKEHIPDVIFQNLKKRIGNRKVILWNPHFCMDTNEQYSTFFDFKEIIIKYFKLNTDIFLILRPHPMFYMYVVEHGYMTQEELDSFLIEIQQSENMYVDKSSTYQWVFHLSDAMISDIGSFILEYLATQKPLLFTKVPNSPAMNDDRTIEEYHYPGQTEEQIITFLDMVKNGEDHMKNKRLSIIPEYLHGLDSNIGESIKNHVTKNILKEIYGTENELINSLNLLVRELILVNSI